MGRRAAPRSSSQAAAREWKRAQRRRQQAVDEGNNIHSTQPQAISSTRPNDQPHLTQPRRQSPRLNHSAEPLPPQLLGAATGHSGEGEHAETAEISVPAVSRRRSPRLVVPTGPTEPQTDIPPVVQRDSEDPESLTISLSALHLCSQGVVDQNEGIVAVDPNDDPISEGRHQDSNGSEREAQILPALPGSPITIGSPVVSYDDASRPSSPSSSVPTPSFPAPLSLDWSTWSGLSDRTDPPSSPSSHTSQSSGQGDPILARFLEAIDDQETAGGEDFLHEQGRVYEDVFKTYFRSECQCKGPSVIASVFTYTSCVAVKGANSDQAGAQVHMTTIQSRNGHIACKREHSFFNAPCLPYQTCLAVAMAHMTLEARSINGRTCSPTNRQSRCPSARPKAACPTNQSPSRGSGTLTAYGWAQRTCQRSKTLAASIFPSCPLTSVT